MKKQQGFTLVELIVVIVILGILAAAALPRFVDLTTEARVSAVNGLAGAIRGAVGVTEAKFYATGTGASPVTLADGTSVVVGTSGTSKGIPVAGSTGIGAALTDSSGFASSTTGTTTVFQANGAGTPASCQASYDANTGTVTVTTSACQ